jgi:hypothetical protein
MIKVKDLKENQGRFVRETTAPFVIVEDGEQRTETIRVRYYSRAVKESRAIQAGLAAKEKAAGGSLYMSEILLTVLAELPDFVDEKNKPAKVTAELLDSINSVNLNAIQQAIAEDLVPKALPPK